MHYQTSYTMWQFLVKNQIPAIPQTTYFPYLTPCNFLLFPLFKTGVKGHCFASVEGIQQKTTTNLTAIPKSTPIGASSNGSTTGTSVYVCKGSTERVTRLGFIYVIFYTNYA